MMRQKRHTNFEVRRVIHSANTASINSQQGASFGSLWGEARSQKRSASYFFLPMLLLFAVSGITCW